jgi:hypothetical protein
MIALGIGLYCLSDSLLGIVLAAAGGFGVAVIETHVGDLTRMANKLDPRGDESRFGDEYLFRDE